MYNNCIQTNTKGDISHELCANFTSFFFFLFFGRTHFTNYQYMHTICVTCSHDIASSEKWCQCLDKKVQDFSVLKQNLIKRISK